MLFWMIHGKAPLLAGLFRKKRTVRIRELSEDIFDAFEKAFFRPVGLRLKIR